MSLERAQSTGGRPNGVQAGNLELRDPRRRPCPPAPPPPRISDKIADKIKAFADKANSEDNKSSLPSSQPDLGGPPEVPQVQNGNGPSESLRASKSKASTSENETQLKTEQLSSTPGRIERSSSPYSPSSPLRDDDEIARGQTNCKVKVNRSSEEVIESVSMLLKTRDDSLAKCRRNFLDLRKRYDTKKAEINVVQNHVKELRKQVESVSREKKEVQQRLENQVENLDEELRRVKAELKALPDSRSTTESEIVSKLQYTQVALDGQKLFAEMQTKKVSQLESENVHLKKAVASRNVRIGLLKDRITSLEGAIQEDVNDKNVMVGSFNLYMASTQRRVEELFVKKVDYIEDPRLQGYNVSSVLQASQLAIKEENGERKDKDNNAPSSSPSAERIATCCNPPNPDPKQTVVKKEKESVEVSRTERNENGDDKKRKQISISDDDDSSSSSSSSDSVVVLSQTDPEDKVLIENKSKKPKVQ